MYYVPGGARHVEGKAGPDTFLLTLLPTPAFPHTVQICLPRDRVEAMLALMNIERAELARQLGPLDEPGPPVAE